MRLRKIKLAGFKSFVDPTSLELRSDLTAVVGPNGCGKSNIIDAVRWVMGESSAKNLRGESMADVIFNGSSTRKPVGQASIELVFDNTKGLGGEYAQYSEISVRRQATRDGQSNYFLNNARCRRKDITDLFLGTGLGPRSYAIIQQGTISRLIEAKPEDLRGFLEEAAGVSLYRKRRHETEKRMLHTRENLERLTDIQRELEKQLDRLKRQSESAVRYKEYKADQDRLEAELCVLKWQSFNTELQEKSEAIQKASTQLEEKLAARASYDLDLEKTRIGYSEKSDAWKVQQGEHYDLGTQIARLEQTLQHHQEREQGLRQDLTEIEASHARLGEQIEQDEAALTQFAADLTVLRPEHEKVQEQMQHCEQVLTDVQMAMEKWDEAYVLYQEESEKPKQVAEVERVRIKQYETQVEEAAQRSERLHKEQADINVDALEQTLSRLEGELLEVETKGNQSSTEFNELSQELTKQREGLTAETKKLDRLKDQRQEINGQVVSLEALQQAALGKTNEVVSAWLETKGLSKHARLGEKISVEPGYERAVETVLGDALEAVCVPGMNVVTDLIADLHEGNITFIDGSEPFVDSQPNTLAAKVKTDLPIQSLLSDVIVVETLNEALDRHKHLASGQSVITRDGIWLGKNWLRVYRSEEGHHGILSREAELKTLQVTLADLKTQVEVAESVLVSYQESIGDLESKRERLRQDQQVCAQSIKDLSSQISTHRANLEHLHAQLLRLASEMREQNQKSETATQEAGDARLRLQSAIEKMAIHEEKRGVLRVEQDKLRAELQNAREGDRNAKQALHSLQLKEQTLLTQQKAIQEGLVRLTEQKEGMLGRQCALREQMATLLEPQAELKETLDDLLAKQLESDKALNLAREVLEAFEQKLKALEKQRQLLEEEAEDVRNRLEQVKMEWQVVQTRAQTTLETLTQMNTTLEQVLPTLPEEASEIEWTQTLEKTMKRIERLGAINLAAVEEYEGEQERKNYLDAQQADLEEALATLESAIRKIDKETRTRFKETFEKVNAEFKVFFPRLFGGGQAYLELVGDDLLEAGVMVMARPPGKHNSSIHLLSGGEKALTAVALVFAIFQLNPAPFCLLDEVDAPLDDANVGRFCELVKTLSDSVQFIFITHNKLAVEMAQHLVGVTMKEPGVSRLVSVDVEEAVALVD